MSFDAGPRFHSQATLENRYKCGPAKNKWNG